MKQVKLLPILGVGLLLASCLGPQTYFSDVFNTMEELYYPELDNQNRIISNFKVDASLTIDGKVTTYQTFLFGTGIKLINVSQENNEGVDTQRTLTIIYDYAAGGMFASRQYANTPNVTEKVFSAFDDTSFDMFDQAANIAESVLNDELKSILNNQATNLIIGGQPETQDVKAYTLPVAQFVNLSDFEGLVGFVPSDLSLVVTFTTSTNSGNFNVEASGDGKVYEADITLSQPDALVPSNYLLSASEKLTYEGYQA
ncbi:MAG: hypothetical protein ACO3QN_02390 [Bacilli bacterium]